MGLTDGVDVEGEGEEKQGPLSARECMVGSLTGTEKMKGRRELERVSRAPFMDKNWKPQEGLCWK